MCSSSSQRLQLVLDLRSSSEGRVYEYLGEFRQCRYSLISLNFVYRLGSENIVLLACKYLLSRQCLHRSIIQFYTVARVNRVLSLNCALSAEGRKKFPTALFVTTYISYISYISGLFVFFAFIPLYFAIFFIILLYLWEIFSTKLFYYSFFCHSLESHEKNYIFQTGSGKSWNYFLAYNNPCFLFPDSYKHFIALCTKKKNCHGDFSYIAPIIFIFLPYNYTISSYILLYLKQISSYIPIFFTLNASGRPEKHFVEYLITFHLVLKKLRGFKVFHI